MNGRGSYYNEHDPYAAQWLRNLIAAGNIAPGTVDSRSIVDVRADDLKGYRQCHFFAGIGVWSYALRRAGWEDDREIWTGSCPCQPFSDAGRGGAFADERDLFPAWAALIGECRPSVIVGEQVASRVGLAWLDLVHADLEAKAYTVGAVDTCAAGFGAPHIRQRLYFVADAQSGDRKVPVFQRRKEDEMAESGRRSGTDFMADAECGAAKRRRLDLGSATGGIEGEHGVADTPTAQSSLAGWLTPSANEDAAGTVNGKMQHMLTHQAKSVLQTADGQAPNGSPAGTEKRGQLNPAHSRWLMGLPPEWDVCAPTGTRSMPNKPSTSSRHA